MYRALSIILLILGASLVASVAVPIAQYELFGKSGYAKKDKLISPLSTTTTPAKVVLGTKVTDYTRASNWFESALVDEAPTPENIKYYTLSIPKLKINRASVQIAGEDLSKNQVIDIS